MTAIVSAPNGAEPGQVTPVPAKHSLNMWSVAAMGIGSMVGAGIFALLGQVAITAGGQTWLAFAAGGLIALLSGYSYARLAARYPSSQGVLAFFNEGMPSRTAAGAMSLIYVVTLAVGVALVAKAFGAYGARLVLGDGADPFWSVTLAIGIVVLLTFVNIVSTAAVGRAEVILVAIKLTILLALMVAGLKSINLGMLESGPPVSPLAVTGSVGITFFAYAGYGMMANASGDVADPKRTIPRAIFLAIGVVIVLYIGLSLVVLGNVTPENLLKYSDTAVAEAAQPVLGRVGFVLVSISALLATASAINAVIFAFINITRGLSDEHQLPAWFSRPLVGNASVGLLGSVAGILALVAFFSLGAVANIVSATFLITYLAVFVVNWRLRRETASQSWVIALGFALMLAVLAVFLWTVAGSQPAALAAIVIFSLGCFVAEWLIQRTQPHEAPASA